MMQDRPASMSRKPTARTSPRQVRQSPRRVARLAVPGLIVTTRKIAARLRGANTACWTRSVLVGVACIVIGVDSGARRGTKPRSMDNPKQRVTPERSSPLRGRHPR